MEPDDEVTLAVELASLCKELGVLPRAGGLLDQDNYHILLIQAGLMAMNKKEREEMEKPSKPRNVPQAPRAFRRR